jgi:hypothetical protein
MDIVLARYNEKIKWLTDDHGGYENHQFFIYNKGEQLDYPCKDVPNVGRESETYFRHIIENYENLAPHTLFLQGDPFSHSATMFHTIRYVIHLWANTLEEKMKQFESYVVSDNLEPDNVHMKYYKLLFGDPVPTHLKFSPGCQWAVSRDLIRAHPKEFYEKLRQMVIDSEGTDNEVFNENYISPWTIERLFPYIFITKINPAFFHKESSL